MIRNQDNWKIVRIDDLKAKEQGSIAIGPFGSRMKSEVYTQSGVPIIRGNNLGKGKHPSGDFVFVPEDFAKQLGNANVYEGDLVFPHRGNIGEVGVVANGHFVLSTSLMKLSVDRTLVNPFYLYYFFRSNLGRYELLKNSSTVGTPGIATPLTSLRGIEVPLPSLPVQDSIANILGTLDDKIALNQRRCETLEAMVQGLFKSWFLDFEPVRAKAEGRNPGLPKHIFALFPSAFQGSDLGPIPEGWKHFRLPEILDINPTRFLRKGDAAPYLDMANMPIDGHSPSDVTKRPFGSGTRFMNGDTLMARITPCLENGKTAFVDFLEKDEVGWGSTEYIVLRPKPPMPPEFAYCLARSQVFREFAIKSMTGSSGRQRVATELLNHYAIVTPPPEVFQTFGMLIKPLFERARVLSDEAVVLAKKRDLLLPELLNGNLIALNE